MIKEELKIFFLHKEPVFRKFPILHPNDSVLRKKFQKGYFIITPELRFYIWYNAYLNKFSLTQLCFRIKDPEAVDLISKQFNAIRFFIAK